MTKLLSGVLIVILLAGCQASPRPVPGSFEEAEPAVDFQLPEGRKYVIDPGASDLRILIGSAGTLARFGHDHVAGGAVVDGQVVIAEPFGDSGLEMTIRVADLELDRPEWLEAEGMDTSLTAEEIARTRDNMLSAEALDAETFPEIRLQSVAVSGPRWQPDIKVRITLRGETRQTVVPIALEISDDGLVATGRMVVNQSDFGLEPFSAMGGALAVADELVLRFRIVARKR